MKTKIRLWLVMCAVAIASGPLPIQVAAAAELEQITVTARKRAESLQDVPVSLQAINGEHIAEQGMVDIQQLAPYTPNFSYINAAGASDLYFMRGLGTWGSGIHFEPSVGQVFNGFFSTRSRLGRGALIDLAQAEVLKGPQGAIIGKNTSLGAINLTSNKPTEQFEARFTSQANLQSSDGYEVEGIISGPLSKSVRGRAVINYRDVDGWVSGINGDDRPTSEDLTARFMLDFDLSETLTLDLMYQRTDYDREGKSRVFAGCLEFQPPGGPAHSIARAERLGVDCSGVSDNSTAVNIRRDASGTAFDAKEPTTIESDFFGATFTKEFEGFTLTSLTSWTEYDINDSFSGDVIAVERVSINNQENFEQLYQEFRINGSTDSFDYTLGAMFFSGDLDAGQSFHAIAGAIGPPVPRINPDVSRNEFQQSETDSRAIFGQIDYQFNDRFGLSVGGRVTQEDREGRKAQVVGEIYTSNLANALVGCNTPTSPLSACTFGNDGLTAGAPVTGEIDDTNFSYNIALQYSLNENNNFYISTATGFKSGGFDLRGAGNPESFIFDEEESTNFEIGGKHFLLDGSLRFNWAIFSTEVDGLQVSANDPILFQQIVAAADVSSEGFEADLLWSTPVDGLNLSFVAGYSDATYDRFSGSCYLSQVETGTGCVGNGIAAGQRTGVQDLSGKQLPVAPELSYVAGAEYRFDVAGGMELAATAKYIYIDDQYLSIERDPLGYQDSTTRLDASLVLSSSVSSDHPWTVALVGRNLTDEIVHGFVNASTLSGSALVVTSIEETRSVALRFSIGY